jgi:hypothetical protein
VKPNGQTKWKMETTVQLFIWESEMCRWGTPFILMEMVDRCPEACCVVCIAVVSYCPCGRELFIATTTKERRK